MKTILCLLLVFFASPLARTDDFDYVKIVQEYYIGQGAFLNLNLTNFAGCFNQSTAQDFIFANFFLPALVLTWSEGQYKSYEFVSHIVGNASNLMTPAVECMEALPNFDEYLLATFGTTNLQLVFAYYEAFIFTHTQDFLYLSSPIMNAANDMDFYAAGKLQASLYQTAVFLVNQVGLYREIYGLIESGAFAAQNLSAPASTIECYENYQAQLILGMIAGLTSVVGNSNVDDVWANTASWLNTNQIDFEELQEVFHCESQNGEVIKYFTAIGLNTTYGFAGRFEYYVNSNPQEYKDYMLDLAISIAFEDYLGAGAVVNSIMNSIADSINA